MSVEKKPPFLVQAVYSFKGQNNDELCFRKGDIITVTQVEEGGWWEGTLKDKTGWFPSNYVKEFKADSPSVNSNPLSKSSVDLLAQQIANRAVIVKDLIDSEKAHVAELENLINKFLVPISTCGALSREEYDGMVSNITEIVDVHENLLKGLREWSTKPAEQQRIGRLFITTAVAMKLVHEKYCSSHPKAVLILDKHRDELNRVMEENGATTPGILVLIAGLSKPFRRLDKYNGILQEIKRYMEESHVDRGDVSRSISVYKDIATTCSAIRRQKELELQILNGGVRGWEGDDLTTLGEILYIGSVAVGPELKDRYFVLFPNTLLILSVSNSMTAFVYEGKLPLTGIQVTKLENNDDYKNAFEIKGPMIEEIVAICQTKEDQQAWLEKLAKQMNAAKHSPSSASSSASSPSSKSTSGVFYPNCSAIAAVPKPPPHAIPSISHQPWSITRLRPSPPMHCYFLNGIKQQRNSNKLCERSFTEDAQILQVIEGYCTSAKLRYTINSVENINIRM
ncbi:rho guanine nucleotide exchange factor 7 isoform X2 [Planococcus citri]|uniref:rho guanine nucleotide exchange factor 7 isoform X2 n=1 Tax=Planococcus citri TaxID=170843 RepID=UPI0031F924B6